MPDDKDKSERAREIEQAVKDADARRRGDADVGSKLDKILDAFDALHQQLGTLDARLQKLEAEAREGGDDEGDDADDDRRERRDSRLHRRDVRRRDATHPGAEAPMHAEPGRRSAREHEPEEDDPEFGTEDDATECRPGEREDRLPADARERDDRRRLHFSDAQARADSACRAWGESAPHFMQGETLREYRLRLLRPWQKYSSEMRELPLSALDPKTLGVVERRIYADAIAASKSNDLAAGVLREVLEHDGSGRRITRFYGDFNAAFAPWRLAVKGVKIKSPGAVA
jgi:hypothetical protein